MDKELGTSRSWSSWSPADIHSVSNIILAEFDVTIRVNMVVITMNHKSLLLSPSCVGAEQRRVHGLQLGNAEPNAVKRHTSWTIPLIG